MTSRGEWHACSYCGAQVGQPAVDELCQFSNSDDYLCGKPAHARCAQAAASAAGLHAERVLCRDHLRAGQWTRPLNPR